MNEHRISHFLDKAQYCEDHQLWLEAAQYYQRLIAEAPETLEFHLRLAAVYGEMGNVHAAERVLLKLLAMDAPKQDVLLALGTLFYKHEDLDKALFYFEQLVPFRVPQAHVTMGVIAYRRGDYVTSERHFARAQELDPAGAGIRLLHAEVLITIGRPEQAEKMLRKHAKEQPADWKALHLLGIAHGAQHDWERAVLAFAAALRAQPDDIDLLCASAGALMQLRRISDAEQQLRAAYQLSPDAPAVLNSLGALALLKADREKAITFFSKALEIDPTNVVALEHVRLLSSTGR